MYLCHTVPGRDFRLEGLGLSSRIGRTPPWSELCGCFPKGPCAKIVYTLAPKAPTVSREYFQAKVYTNWAHIPLRPLSFAVQHAEPAKDDDQCEYLEMLID